MLNTFSRPISKIDFNSKSNFQVNFREQLDNQITLLLVKKEKHLNHEKILTLIGIAFSALYIKAKSFSDAAHLTLFRRPPQLARRWKINQFMNTIINTNDGDVVVLSASFGYLYFYFVD